MVRVHAIRSEAACGVALDSTNDICNSIFGRCPTPVLDLDNTPAVVPHSCSSFGEVLAEWTTPSPEQSPATFPDSSTAEDSIVGNSAPSRRLLLPIAAGLMGLVLAGLAVGFATGGLQVRPRVPAYELSRAKETEQLFPGRDVKYVFQFRGGVPRCWAQVDRIAGSEALAIDAKNAAVQGPSPRSAPQAVEGIVALLGPAKEGEPYTLHLIVSKLTFPEGQAPRGTPSGVGYRADAKPGGSKLPERFGGSGETFIDHLTSPKVRPGDDIELVDALVDGRDRDRIRVKMWLRFYIPEELATAEPGNSDGQ